VNQESAARRWYWPGYSRALIKWLTPGLLLLALLFGGGPGSTLEPWLSVPALMLVALLVAHARHEAQSLTPPRIAWLLAGLLLLLPLLQLVPLPLILWERLPGRAEIAAALQLAGVQPAWPSWSLAPRQTEIVAFGLLVPAAIFLAACRVDAATRLQWLRLILAVTAVSVVLGLIQRAAGPDSALYFYQYSNVGNAVGFFANRNHFASLLVGCLPIALVLWRRQSADSIALAAFILLAVVGISATRSRTALPLLVLVAIFAIALARVPRRAANQQRQRLWLRWWQVWVLLGGLALLLSFTMDAWLQRLQGDVRADARWIFATHTWQLAAATRGLGYGFGSFSQVYNLIGEAAADGPTYVNHAHNDYLELWLEGGAAAALLVLAALIGLFTLCWRRVRAWRREQGSALSVAAGCTLLLWALHSLVDYPLRTLAIQCVAALLLAVLLMPAAERSHD
jgi:O-antigen ligase